MALNRVVRQRVLERDYAQFAKNDISFLGLQFFVAGLHDDSSLEVIKNGTTDMYQAFLVAHAYETAVKDKKKNNGNGAMMSKINKMDACFDEDENAEIEAIKRKHQQKRMFCSNNGSAYQQRTNGSNGNNNGSSNNRNGGNQQSGSGGQRKPNPAFG
jgi:hypothetical protein